MILKEKIVISDVISKLPSFLNYWEQKEDIYLGPSVKIELDTFLFDLSNKGILPPRITGLCDTLRPLLCKTPEQQGSFDEHFKNWLISNFEENQISSIEKTNKNQIVNSVLILIIVAIIFGFIYFFTSPATPESTPTILFSGEAKKDTGRLEIKVASFENVNHFNFPFVFSRKIKIIDDSLATLPNVNPTKIKLGSIQDTFMISWVNSDTTKPLSLKDTFKLATIYFTHNVQLKDSIIITFISKNFSFDYSPNSGLIISNGIIQVNSNEKVVKDNAISLNLTWLIISAIVGFFVLLIFFYLNLNVRKEETKNLKRRVERAKDKFILKKLHGVNSDVIHEDIRQLKINIPFLNQLVATDQSELHIGSTIRGTLQNAGVFTPKYQKKYKKVTFKILVDKKSTDDHLADYVFEIIQLFKEFSVDYKLFYFDGDFRSCKAANSSTFVSLKTIHEPNSKLLIFSNLDDLINPFNSKISRQGKEFLDLWSSKIMFSPEHLKQSHQKYKTLTSLGLSIFPLSVQGIDHYILKTFQENRMQIAEGLSHYLPASLRDYDIKWIDRLAPELDEEKRMLGELKKYLGPQGFYWLQTLAIFPHIKIGLTTYIGKHLTIGNQKALFHPEIFLRLIQLPWLRFGYMPDWLREQLIFQLSDESKIQIRKIILAYLVDPGQAGSSFFVEYAEIAQKSISEVLHSFFVKIKKPLEINERIFCGFMEGNLTFQHPNISVEKKETTQKEEIGLIPKIIINVLIFFVLTSTFIGVLILAVFSFGLIPLILFWPQIQTIIDLSSILSRDKTTISSEPRDAYKFNTSDKSQFEKAVMIEGPAQKKYYLVDWHK